MRICLSGKLLLPSISLYSVGFSISSVERQKGLTTSHLHIQSDPLASKLTVCIHSVNVGTRSIVVELGTSMQVVAGLNPAQTEVASAIMRS